MKLLNFFPTATHFAHLTLCVRTSQMAALLSSTVSCLYPRAMKNMFLFSTQGFIKHITAYVTHTQTYSRRMTGYCAVVLSKSTQSNIILLLEKKVTMAMIFSRQVKVWTGTLLKHHLFPVGNRCGIFVNSIPLRQAGVCVGKEDSSGRHLPKSRKE